jgi:hypothetical protein
MSGFCIRLSRDYNRVFVPLDKNCCVEQIKFLNRLISIYQMINTHIFVNFLAWHYATSQS